MHLQLLTQLWANLMKKPFIKSKERLYFNKCIQVIKFSHKIHTNTIKLKCDL